MIKTAANGMANQMVNHNWAPWGIVMCGGWGYDTASNWSITLEPPCRD